MFDQSVSPYAPPRAILDSGATQVSTLTMATPRSRLAALLIDVSFLLPVAIGAFILGGPLNPARHAAPPAMKPGTLVLALACLLYLLAAVAYQVVMLSTRGQTLGKRAMHIRIVKLDGSKPGFLHSVLLRLLVNALPRAIPVVGVFYPFVDGLFIFRANRRCLHDLVAGTRVVQAQTPAVVAANPGS